MKLKTLARWKKTYDKPRQCIKKQRHYFAHAQLPTGSGLRWYRPRPGCLSPRTPDASHTVTPWAPQRAPRTRGSRSA